MASSPDADEGETPTPDIADKEVPLGVRLVGDFTVAGKTVRLEIEDSGLKWNGEGHKSGVVVLWDDVITSYLGRACRGPGVKAGEGPQGENDKFTLHYIEHQKTNIMRHKYVTFQGKAGNLKEWIDNISDRTGLDRPKRLLTIVNPIGGQKKGRKLYETVVAPLFALAGIDAELIVTERFRHAEEIVKTYDFSKVDGLIVSGGDGLMQEVLHTLIPRYNEGVNLDDPDVEIKPLPITLGALPTGTGNGISMACHGCTDLETGALVAVKGKKRYLHIASVHETPGRLLGYSCTTIGYGFWADLLMKTDDSRWLKTLRYQVTMVKNLASAKRQFQVEGQYLPAKRPDGDERPREDQSAEGWVDFAGMFTGVYGMIGGFHRMVGQSKLQCKPDGPGFNLVLEKETGRLNYLKWLFRFAKLPHDAYDVDHIDEHYVKAYKFRVVDPGLDTDRGTPTGLGAGASAPGTATGKQPKSDVEKRNDELEHQISFEGEFRRTETKSMDVRIRTKVTKFYSTKYEDM